MVATIVLGAGAVYGQDYPSKPVRIVTAEAGGGNDVVARVIAQALTRGVGQQVIVDNRGGANGAIAAQAVIKSPPDGYTLLLYSSTLWIGPLLGDSAPYDPVKDFAAITLAAGSPNILVTHPSLPVKSVKDLIALAKARPGALNYAAGVSGTPTHLAAELFKSMARVNVVYIPYRGSSSAITDLIAGHVQLSFASAPAVMQHVKSGRLRTLAVTSTRPSALLPGIPTVGATLPGYESGLMFGVFAPLKTPPALIKQLNQEMLRALGRGELKEQLLNAGVETAGSSPDELAAAIKTDMARWAKVIKDAGIRAQ
jgi:tripartite-type tricarboxylate transporter receptor subunit TctC